ncbi:MAG TPA: ribonuclease III domain-containing protein, partial [Methanomicrobiales archaeon]|nr:ribonuclease III domain-containing protein [Methanomicrobiales archaeon]
MELSKERKRRLLKILERGGIRIDNPSTESFTLYNRALTHSSSENPSYERLEFLGDRVLNLVVAKYLYDNKEEYQEGEMTKRMEFTNNDNLGDLIQNIGLFQANDIDIGKGSSLTHNIYADVFEAWTGVLFLEMGLPTAQDFVL